MRSAAVGDRGVESIQYAISLTQASIVDVDGDTIRLEVDGLSEANSLLGPPEQYANASLFWYIGTAGIFKPRLVVY